MKVIAEIKISRNDNIAEVTRDYKPSLPTGPCEMQLRTNKILKVERKYIGSIRNVKTEGRSVHQFFFATDKDNRTGKNIMKWEIIQNEMNNPADIIEEITLVVSKDI